MSVVQPSHLSDLPLPPAVPLLEGYRLLRRSPPEALLHIARTYGDVVRWRGVQTIYCLNHPVYVRQVLTQSWPPYSKDTIDYRVVGRT